MPSKVSLSGQIELAYELISESAMPIIRSPREHVWLQVVGS